MTKGFINTRDNAEKEAKAEIRRARRAKRFPDKAAEFRRYLAQNNLTVAREWREKGEMDKAVLAARVARGQLIIARAWDREAERLERTK